MSPVKYYLCAVERRFPGMERRYFWGKVTMWVAMILRSTEVPTGYTVVEDSLLWRCWPDGRRTV